MDNAAVLELLDAKSPIKKELLNSASSLLGPHAYKVKGDSASIYDLIMVALDIKQANLEADPAPIKTGNSASIDDMLANFLGQIAPHNSDLNKVHDALEQIHARTMQADEQLAPSLRTVASMLQDEAPRQMQASEVSITKSSERDLYFRSISRQVGKITTALHGGKPNPSSLITDEKYAQFLKRNKDAVRVLTGDMAEALEQLVISRGLAEQGEGFVRQGMSSDLAEQMLKEHTGYSGDALAEKLRMFVEEGKMQYNERSQKNYIAAEILRSAQRSLSELANKIAPDRPY